jgi:hypothetical protein
MKAIIFATLLVCLFALNTQEIIDMQDKCTRDVFGLLKPQIDAKVEEYKNVTDYSTQNKNVALEVEILALIQKGKMMLDKCNENKAPIKVGDIVEWDGYAFLLASNCFKDIGIVLLLTDTVIVAPGDKVNDLMVAIFVFILGRQGFEDCKVFEQFII